MSTELEWEDIKTNDSGYTKRAKVPGGWLVKIVDDVAHFNANEAPFDSYDWRSSICFMPDPEHGWS